MLVAEMIQTRDWQKWYRLVIDKRRQFVDWNTGPNVFEWCKVTSCEWLIPVRAWLSESESDTVREGKSEKKIRVKGWKVKVYECVFEGVVGLMPSH